jgi:hypothetical protein
MASILSVAVADQLPPTRRLSRETIRADQRSPVNISMRPKFRASTTAPSQTVGFAKESSRVRIIPGVLRIMLARLASIPLGLRLEFEFDSPSLVY